MELFGNISRVEIETGRTGNRWEEGYEVYRFRFRFGHDRYLGAGFEMPPRRETVTEPRLKIKYTEPGPVKYVTAREL